MNPYQTDVYNLHKDGVFIPVPPPEPTLEKYRYAFRCQLILDELLEFIEAGGCFIASSVEENDRGTYELTVERHPRRVPRWPAMIDGLVDILVTTYGAAVEMGIDLDPFWAEVQRANAEKAKGPFRADGKRLKPEGWTPPNIEETLEKSISLYRRRCKNNATTTYYGYRVCEAHGKSDVVLFPSTVPSAWHQDDRCLAVDEE